MSRWVQKPSLQEAAAPPNLNSNADEAEQRGNGQGDSILQDSQETKWPNIIGIDSEYGRFLLAGDLDPYIDLLVFFAAENATLVDRLNKHVTNREWSEAAQMIHKLKGQIANLGAREIASNAAALEAASKTPSPAIAELYDGVIEGNNQLLTAINGWLKIYKPS